MRPLQLNDSINTFDLAEALRNEYGTFKVILPSGDEIYVGCEPGHSITHLVWGDNSTTKRPFLVTKITEPVTMDNRLTGAGAPPGIRVAS
jgi:hypothetical protein